MNILHTNDFVNSPEELFNTILLIKNGLELKQIQDLKELPKSNGKKRKDFEKKTNAYCPFSVQSEYCYFPREKKTKVTTRPKPQEKYSELWKIADNADEFKKAVISQYYEEIDKMHFVTIKNTNGIFIFPAREKGSPSYNKNVRDKLESYAKLFSEEYKHYYFETLTLNLKKFSGGVIAQHLKAVEYSMQFCQLFAQQFHGKYLIVAEQQSRNVIHFHLELFTNKDCHSGNERNRKDGKHEYIYKGLLADFVKRNWEWGHTDTQKANPEQVVSYLTKYIDKNTENDFWAMAHKKKLSKTDYKEILTFMMPKICGYRSYRTSQLNAWERKRLAQIVAEREEFRKKYFELQEKIRTLKNGKTRYKPLNDYVAKKTLCFQVLPKVATAPLASGSLREPDRLRAYLIKRRNNLKLPCLSILYSGNFSRLVERYGADFRAINRLSDSEKEKILKSCIPLGCGDCYFGRQIRDFIMGTDTANAKVDNRDLLKPFFWKSLSKDDKEMFTSFNFSQNTEIDTDIFAEITERISEMLLAWGGKPLSGEGDFKHIHKIEKKEFPMSFYEWKFVLCRDKVQCYVSGDKRIRLIAENLFIGNGGSLGENLETVWSGSGFDELFELYKDWLEENGFFSEK